MNSLMRRLMPRLMLRGNNKKAMINSYVVYKKLVYNERTLTFNPPFLTTRVTDEKTPRDPPQK